jgi:hypothetical protein
MDEAIVDVASHPVSLFLWSPPFRPTIFIYKPGYNREVV